MSYTKRLLLGMALGIALGLFLGERVEPLKVVADGFVRLLQMTVLPYLTASIVLSLGTLDAKQAKQLGLRAGSILLILWGVGIGFALLFPLVFPSIQTGAFFSRALVERRPSFNFVDLYIPSNPFYSLANNIVPAVVLFSIIMGIALIGVERKQIVLDVLAVAVSALSRATRFVVGLTPYGVFAISAVAAGTLEPAQTERVEIYLISYAILAFLIAFWVLPGLVAALTSIPYSEVLGPARTSLITAFIVGNLFIVLPLIIESCSEVLARRKLTDTRTKDVPSVLVPASFNLPHTGKLLSLSFVLFAAWFGDSSIPFGHYPRLALMGLLTFFGSLNSAIPFLLDTFRIPADTFQLFIATSVINSRIGTLVAAVHTVAIGLLGSAALTGALRFHPRRVLRFALITFAVTASVLLGLRTLFSHALKPVYSGGKIIANMKPIFTPVPSTVVQENEGPPTKRIEGDVLGSIRATGVLRVGYLLVGPPYFYRNASGDLVGFDVEMAGRLATDLGVRLVFVPIETDAPGHLEQAVNSGEVDVVMSGIVVTASRASEMIFSKPYQEETLAFLVKDHLREQFSSWDSIRAMGPVTIAAPGLPYFVSLLRPRLPEARFEMFAPDRLPISHGDGMDVILYSAERASILTMIYPQYAVAVPEEETFEVPIAYPIGARDERFRNFINTWIELQRRIGSMRDLYAHWILGKDAEKRTPRWCIIRNVLHWAD